MSDEPEEEATPKVGDEVVTTDEEGEFVNVNITEVFDFDEETGLYKVSADDGEEYHVYWSEEEKTWVHSEE